MYLGKSKQAILLAGFLYLAFSVYGQEGKRFNYHFNGDLQERNVITGDRSIIIYYTLSEIDLDNFTNENGAFYRISAPGHTQTSDPGKPELPVLGRLISIPDGASFRIKISEVRFTVINPSKNNIRGMLFPSQHGETKTGVSQKQKFVIDKKAYSRRGVINPDTVKIESLGKIRGKLFSSLTIAPVRYNPGSNILEVITSMKIEIIFSESITSSSKSASDESSLFNETLAKGVLNYYPETLITGYSDKPVGMIILTDTAFRKHLEPFYTWKRQKGFKLDILYRGEGMAGISHTELKESVSRIYSSSLAEGYPPEYLLIIGSTERIPYYGSGNITDLYYGEFDGNGDYLPDMYIGRIPAPDTTAVKSVVEKIIEYEKFQFADTNKFYSNALVFAGKDATYANYMNGQVKYAVTDYLTPSNKINGFHFYYPDGDTKKDSILSLISKGLSFINYTGHGSSTGWLHVDIKSADIDQFSNRSMYPFVISNACRTAQFDDTASFGNKMLVSDRKGSIGFIGCSNDSYWDEDFAWAVGTGTPNADPSYASTGLGAYDRLFHTHGELPSEWYITMGQINFAGNLSVSSTASLRKKYYWETYALLGDPSIIPIIGTPEPFRFSLPDTLPNGIRSLSATIDPFAYIAISHSNTLLDASFASPSGSVVLELPYLSNDSCLVVVTGQNKIPYIKTIYISDLNSEFINLSESSVNDSEANNNGKADFGETIYLKLKISNLGLQSAENLSAAISSTSPWLTINTGSVVIGTLQGKSEITLEDDLQLKIDDEVPDQGIITIDLTLKDTRIEKKFRIDIKVHAPRLEIINCIIDDSAFGNNNFIADPGENFTLIFQVKNLGSSNTSGQFFIASQESDLEIINPSIKSGILQFGETSDIQVDVKLAESARYGDYINLISTLDCSPFIVTGNFTFRVGRIRESFESSTFRVFPWINLSEKPWTITASNSVDGTLSARSGAIGHNSASTLMIRTYFPEADTLKFYYKVSSEINYDYFQFNLNNTEMMRKSGETEWDKKSVPVPAGLNKLEWIYKKDNSVSQGADGAWIDLIDFSESVVVKYIGRDLEVAGIVAPVQKEVYGMEPVTVTVRNTGRDTLDGFSLAYQINDKFPVIQYFKDILIPYQDSLTVTFDRRADLDLSGIYDLTVFGYENNDDYLANDTVMVRVENTEIEETVNLYPNPFTDQLNITINSKVYRNVRINLINFAGRLIYSDNIQLTEGENQLVINTQKLSPSLYFLDISGANYTKTFPVIKLKR